VFLLVAATFSTIYLTQPVLPVLREEFGIDAAKASLTVSAVIFGIALATLPFGRLADRLPARPIILVGGTLASLCGFLCAATTSFPLLVAGRFLQGVFVPSLTTCLVVYLVQALGTGGKSVRMRIEHGSAMQADLCFRNGRIVFAECGEEKGVDVVYRVICWQDAGTFRIEPIRSFPPENVSAPTDYILLEGSRRLDEHQAGG